MTRLFLAVSCLALAACSQTLDANPGSGSESTERLVVGTWTGGLTPMNHPDHVTPLTFDVGYEGDTPAISIGGPGGTVIPTRDVDARGDSLLFVFDEPEAGVALQCALAADGRGGYEGRCADAEGKWAGVTMAPRAQ